MRDDQNEASTAATIAGAVLAVVLSLFARSADDVARVGIHCVDDVRRFCVTKLRVLIHTHDTFKPNAKSGVAIADPYSHASLARQFLAKYVSDADLLNMVQFHDEPFAFWKKHRYGGDYSDRLGRLLDLIEDWDLFLAFLVVDGCTAGKSAEPLEWFFVEIRDRVKSRVDATWIRIVANPEGISES